MRIPLQPDQSPASVLTAFLRAEATKVDLVFPSSTAFFDDPANLDLLIVQAKLSGKSFHIITENEILAGKLAAMGVSVEHAKEHAAKAEHRVHQAEEKKAKPDTSKETSIKRGRSFEEIQRDLSENGVDEFTKRYFDLEAPRAEKSENPGHSTDVSGPGDSSFVEVREIKSSRSLRHANRSEASSTGKNAPPSLEEPQNYEAEYAKIAFAEEEITSFVKKPARGDEGSLEKSDLGNQLAFAKYYSRRVLFLSIGGVILLLAGIVWGLTQLPRATLTVFAQREKAAFSVDVLASQKVSDVDLETRSIPLQRIQADKEIASTSDAKTQGTLDKKASVSATVINELPHPQPMIPSRFQSATGQIYWSQRNIKVPPAKSVGGKLQPGTLLLDLIADKTGKEFNLECSQKAPCRFSIPAWKGTENFGKLYALATSPVRGGAVGRGYIVGKDEYKKAELALKDNLQREAQKELIAQVPTGFTLLESTITSDTATISSTPGEGELALDGKFTIHGKVSLRAFLIKTNDLKSLIDKITKAQIPQDKLTRPESVTFQYSLQQFDLDKNQALMKVQAQEELQLKLDPQAITQTLLGKSEAEVQKILTDMPHVQSAEVVLWPFWVRKIPSNPARVTIEIK